ncbi:3D-(3,5/4)-trihydroxycyclohexane-1,2-dione acylhydrolase (decyclizing) [Parashewanella spongiae]|uniref:3D-(3,5/4)-trihydroxycyclohexane-1,2-dione acylhydrolase (Decyclizing) n=1 Tax=Parashewanella spongiae TaxID=342950 RepID=A0A3A6TB94_9GAMM|nr:3D-(3,5/4)-trihydroxycyclohexane-1,2-dione acylhydrolase (decyclizing) [Parashewanella spongiae]MCL1079868.1 3D-(3,5/4)-trihydroxycyclohexane-1,2-dione acylhydrolase (decyclizing) [Parashewanella spongiae]RJY06663.1 3D-(3,5/4)-trihydroxycyclohexane-1,2-dione acylhydrolase (decyclizing) [Parashewanella spongiae]
METLRLTTAQAIVKYLAAQKVEINGKLESMFAGCFAIFGHGNVAGLGEALYHAQDVLPTYRGHNEQGMAHAAIAFAKQHNRRRMMACTSSIGPGAANMVTAAALAHVNRLPVLFMPGDTFANRTPDPVLQQVEAFHDPSISTNDCFKPVSRYFDRISRPEQIITSLPMAMHFLTDAADCGPVTLSLCQDVQAEAYDFPASMFEQRVHQPRRQMPDSLELASAAQALLASSKPMIIVGGGVHYSNATAELKAFAEKHNIPVAETQAGKSALNWEHPNYVGAIGVTGSQIANEIAEQADVIFAVGTRLQDFTTASRTLFKDKTFIQLNASKPDAIKHNALPLVADAKATLPILDIVLKDWKADTTWLAKAQDGIASWNKHYDEMTSIANAPATETGLPSDAQVLGAVKRTGDALDVVICAAGGLPGELHKLWRCDSEKSYHVEYGYSCMGYEIAAGLGVKMAQPEREAIVVVGDGSYMMMNSELATSVMMGQKIIVVVLDNRGFGCINRLQKATGGAPFNNLLEDCQTVDSGAPKLDFAAHAKAMGAESEQVSNLNELESALKRARKSERSYVVAIDTDPYQTSAGGYWWDVAVPQVSQRKEVNASHEAYIQGKQNQPY